MPSSADAERDQRHTSPPGAFGAALSLRNGKSAWEATPASVGDRFAALAARGVRSVGIFEVSHGGLPVGLAPSMVAAWTAALQDFVRGKNPRRPADMSV